MEDMWARRAAIERWWNDPSTERNVWLDFYRSASAMTDPVPVALVEQLPAERVPAGDGCNPNPADQWVYWIVTGQHMTDGHFILSAWVWRILAESAGEPAPW